MDSEILREKLEELHLALMQLTPAEKPLQEKRDALAAQIRETLDHEDLEGFHLSLHDTFDVEYVAFEEKHPRIAQLMGGVKEMLSSIGI